MHHLRHFFRDFKWIALLSLVLILALNHPFLFGSPQDRQQQFVRVRKRQDPAPTGTIVASPPVSPEETATSAPQAITSAPVISSVPIRSSGPPAASSIIPTTTQSARPETRNNPTPTQSSADKGYYKYQVPQSSAKALSATPLISFMIFTVLLKQLFEIV